MNKKELAKVTRSRYKLANKKTKSIILNEFCYSTKYHRKYAIELFNNEPKRNKKRALWLYLFYWRFPLAYDLFFVI